jgi:superfamily II DNA or RNA helicase
VITRVGDEGIDIPDASIGIIASGTGSKRQYIQRIGRLLRPKHGKRAIIYEIYTADTTEKFEVEKRSEALPEKLETEKLESSSWTKSETDVYRDRDVDDSGAKHVTWGLKPKVSDLLSYIRSGKKDDSRSRSSL